MTKRKWTSTGFGDRLKTARDAAGKSQSQIASEVGVDVTTISRLERGEQEPAWPLVLALCGALGVTCEAFSQVEASAPSAASKPGPGRPRKASGEKAKKQGRRKEG